MIAVANIDMAFREREREKGVVDFYSIIFFLKQVAFK